MGSTPTTKNLIAENRQQAIKLNYRKYYGRKCSKHPSSPRYLLSGLCCECVNEKAKEKYTKNIPLTWLETVLICFLELWEIKIKNAKAEGTLPAPMTTKEIKKYIIKKNNPDDLPLLVVPLSKLELPFLWVA